VKLGSISKCNNNLLVAGDVVFPCANHFCIATFSYLLPLKQKNKKKKYRKNIENKRDEKKRKRMKDKKKIRVAIRGYYRIKHDAVCNWT